MNSLLLQRPLPSREERAFNEISLLLESSSNLDKTLQIPLSRSPGKEARTSQGGGYSIHCVSAERGTSVLKARSATSIDKNKQVFIPENPAGISLPVN